MTQAASATSATIFTAESIAAISAMADVATVVVALVGVLVACYQLRHIRRQVKAGVTAHYIEAVERLVHKRYVEAGAGDEPIKIGNNEVVSLRMAKTSALKTLFDPEKAQDWTWNSSFYAYVPGGSPWQNKVCYLTAQALQDIGEAVLMGLIPFQYALTVLADQFVDDWLICSNWVRSYRHNERVALPGKSGSAKSNRDRFDDYVNTKAAELNEGLSLDYHRRHAEWLGIISAFWLEYRGFRYPRVECLFSLYSPSDLLASGARQQSEVSTGLSSSRARAFRRLEEISKIDRALMSDEVAREVELMSKWIRKAKG